MFVGAGVELDSEADDCAEDEDEDFRPESASQIVMLVVVSESGKADRIAVYGSVRYRLREMSQYAIDADWDL